MIPNNRKESPYSNYIRKTLKGLKRAFCPLKPLKLCFKAIKSLKIFKTRISLKIFILFLWILLHLAPFFFLRKLRKIKHFDVLLMYVLKYIVLHNLLSLLLFNLYPYHTIELLIHEPQHDNFESVSQTNIFNCDCRDVRGFFV